MDVMDSTRDKQSMIGDVLYIVGRCMEKPERAEQMIGQIERQMAALAAQMEQYQAAHAMLIVLYNRLSAPTKPTVER